MLESDQRETADDAVVALGSGSVRGEIVDGIARFLGIPYAAPPFGPPHRFAAPAPVPPWEGVRDARRFGATAPKLPYSPPLSDLLDDPTIAGDDCLNLNVWTPDPDAQGLPVMVWIHGGSLKNGSSAQPMYDGRAFARDGVVLVSINYRLGIEGFGLFPDAPANRGLLDVIAALDWVSREIAGFGGDAGNVTVFGQSAGANLISALLAAPGARGLFHRAALQSGPPVLQTPKKARRTVSLMAKRLGIAPTAAAFAAADRDDLLAAQGAVTRGGDPITGANGFGLVADASTIPAEPLETIRQGAGAPVDLLLGSTTHEHRLWFVPGRVNDRITPVVYHLALRKFRVPRAVAKRYRSARPGQPLGEVLGAIATDLLIAMPLQRIARDHPARAYVYEFAWESHLPELGACHALELAFVFDTLATSEATALTGEAPPQELADRMHRAWVDFAKTGDPGWQPWDATSPVLRFDGDGMTLLHAPHEDERSAWP